MERIKDLRKASVGDLLYNNGKLHLIKEVSINTNMAHLTLEQEVIKIPVTTSVTIYRLRDKKVIPPESEL